MSTQHHEESCTMPMSTAKCQHVPTTPFSPPFLTNNNTSNANLIPTNLDTPFSSLYTTNSYSSSLQKQQPFNPSNTTLYPQQQPPILSSFPSSSNYFQSSISSGDLRNRNADQSGVSSTLHNSSHSTPVSTSNVMSNPTTSLAVHSNSYSHQQTTIDPVAAPLQSSSHPPPPQPPVGLFTTVSNNTSNNKLIFNATSNQNRLQASSSAVGGNWSPSVTHLPNMSTPIKTVASGLPKNIPILQTNIKRSSLIQKPNYGDVSTTTDSQSSPPPPSQQLSTQSSTRNLPKDAVAILKNWFFEHQTHPYPTEEEKAMLCEKTGLSQKRINYWFINARRRLLPNLKKEEKKAKSVTSVPGKRKRRMDERRSHPSESLSRFISTTHSDGADEMDVHIDHDDLGEENRWVVECLLELSKNEN